MIKPIKSEVLEQKLSQFSEKQKKILFKNLAAIELTSGCSGACPDCGAGAMKGVREYIPYKSLSGIFENYGKYIGLARETILYSSSDPFDYDFGGKNYLDIHKKFYEETKINPVVTTHIPKGKEKEILELIVKDNYSDEIRIIDRISVMKSNYSRINNTFLELSGCKEEDQLIIQKGIEILKNGELFIPEKIREENGFEYNDSFYFGGDFSKEGNDSSYVLKSQFGNVVSKGKPVDFGSFMGAMKKRKKNIESSPWSMGNSGIDFVDFYSMNLPKGQQHALKLGEKFGDDLATQGLGCFHGVIMTPRGFETFQTVRPSKEHPNGEIRKEITSENFEIIPLTYLDVQFNTKFKYKLFLKQGKKRKDDKSLIQKMFPNQKSASFLH